MKCSFVRHNATKIGRQMFFLSGKRRFFVFRRRFSYYGRQNSFLWQMYRLQGQCCQMRSRTALGWARMKASEPDLAQPLCYRAFSLSPQSPENSPVTLHVITRNHSPFTHNKTIQICEQKNSNIFGGWLLEMFFDLVKDYRVFLRHSGPSEIPCSIEVGGNILLSTFSFSIYIERDC